MIDRLVRRFFAGIEALIAGMLAIMVLLVLGNVVLRYGFNTGITVSEELSRWLFIWMTFLGAALALHERGHLGVDMLVARLPPPGKKACLLLAHGVMLWIVLLLLQGGWEQARINIGVMAPVTGASMAIVFAAAIVFALLAGLILLADLWRLLTGRLADDELVMVQESEEANQLQQVLQAGKSPPA